LNPSTLSREQFLRRADLPAAGWVLVATIDNFSANFVCQNCGFPHVRYVHELENRRAKRRVMVGCVCAEHLTQDFSTPRLRERELKGWAGRRTRFPTLNWKLSLNGNLRLKKEGRIFVVKQGKWGGWSASYLPRDDYEWIPVPGWHKTAVDAKLAAFDAVYPRPGAQRAKTQ